MSDTPNLSLPQMAQNSLQPSVTFNDAMQLLDAIAVLIIQDLALNAPPVTSSADVGKRWIVGAAPTGAWAGRANDIALCTDANLWLYITPKAEWRGKVLNNNGIALNKYYRFTGAAWVDDSAAGGVTEAPEDGTPYARQDGGWVGAKQGTVTSVNGAAPDASGNVVVGKLTGINDQSGTGYTLVLADAGKDVRCTNAAAVALTIPPNSGVAFPVGTWLLISQGGAGVVTATAGAGVTLHAVNGAATTAQYDVRALLKTDTDTWSVL